MKKIYLHHGEEGSILDTISNAIESLNILRVFIIFYILYNLLVWKNLIGIMDELFILYIEINYIFFFVCSFFIRYKAIIILRNSFLVFLFNFIVDGKNEFNFNGLGFFFISLELVFFLNYLSIYILGNIITLRDLFSFNNNDTIIDWLLSIIKYLFLEIANFYLHYKFFYIFKIELRIANSPILIGILFSGLFYYGVRLFEHIFKLKRPRFATVIKRFIFFYIELFAAGLYLLYFYEFVEQKQIMNKKLLFSLFLLISFVFGFISEGFLTTIKAFENIGKIFNISFALILFILFFPFIIKSHNLIILFAFILPILMSIKKIKNKKICYISDSLILIFIASLFGSNFDKFIGFSLIFIYILKNLLDFGIYKFKLDVWICKIIVNVLIFLIFMENFSNNKEEKEKEREKMENEKNKLHKIISDSKNENPLETHKKLRKEFMYFSNDNIPPVKQKHVNSSLPMKFDENNCIYKIVKKLKKYIKGNSEKNSLNKYKKKRSKFDDASEFYYLDNILKTIEKEEKKDSIIKILKKNFEEKLIEDDEYKPKWNDDIQDKYLSKFSLYSLDLSGMFKYLNLNEDKDFEIQMLLKEFGIIREPNNNMVTIFVSGFLTENKNSFAEYYKDYSFRGNGKSDYYFYSWPSYSVPGFFEILSEGIGQYNGIGCSFEEAYNNTLIAGEILADIIGSKKFFGSKINLVGHSLGCKVIYQCLSYFSKNYKTLKDTINDVIFLAGAAEMVDWYFSNIVNNFVGGRVIHCFNPNDVALFFSKPFICSPIGLRSISIDYSKIENYETDLDHMDYCNNLDKILEKIDTYSYGKKISFI